MSSSRRRDGASSGRCTRARGSRVPDGESEGRGSALHRLSALPCLSSCFPPGTADGATRTPRARLAVGNLWPPHPETCLLLRPARGYIAVSRADAYCLITAFRLPSTTSSRGYARPVQRQTRGVCV